MFRFKTGNKILSMVDLSLKYPKVYQNAPLGFLTIYRDKELTIEEWLSLMAAFNSLDINEKIKMAGERSWICKEMDTIGKCLNKK